MADKIHIERLSDKDSELSKLRNEIAEKGETLLNKLTNNIMVLSDVWDGIDADVHINNLIRLRNELGIIISQSYLAINNANNKMVSAQEMQNFNSGGRGNVGSRLTGEFGFSLLDQITKSKVSVMATISIMNGALRDLENVISLFEDLEYFFRTKKEALFSEWTHGYDVENIREQFDNFLNNCDRFKGYLTDAKDAFSKVINNLSQNAS